MLTDQMIAILRCPTCREEASGLRPRGESAGAETVAALVCTRCAARYPVTDGVPELLPRRAPTSVRWRVWQAHLRGFAERRARRRLNPDAEQQSRWKDAAERFSAFIDPPPGKVLDVGCGAGILRSGFDEHQNPYYGIDPLKTASVRHFPFALALAESIPFASGAFSCVLVRSALDHFYDVRTFFAEAARVLSADGRLFLAQDVHPGARHDEALDASKVPTHMSEFATEDQLRDAGGDAFTWEESRWATPTQLLVRMTRRPRPLDGHHRQRRDG